MNLEIAEGQSPEVLAMFNVPSCFFFRDQSVPSLLGIAIPNPKTKRHTLLVYVAKDETNTTSDLVAVEDVETTAVALAMVEAFYNIFTQAADKGAITADCLSRLLNVLKERMQ